MIDTMIDSNINAMQKKEAVKAQSPSSLKPEVQPGDTVMFKGKKATVQSVFPNGDVVVLQNGMTIECTRGILEVMNKVDTMEVPMKFKDGIPVNEDMVPCIASVNGIPYVNEQLYVNLDEWLRKKKNMKVKVISEDWEEYSIPKRDIDIQDFPRISSPIEPITSTHIIIEPQDKAPIEANPELSGTPETMASDPALQGIDGLSGEIEKVPNGFVNGEVKVSQEEVEDGATGANIYIKAIEYAEALSDDDLITILYPSGYGYKDMKMRKGDITTLTV